MKEYRFKTPDGKLLQVTLNEEQTAIVTQAESDYIVARDYILSECYYIWRHEKLSTNRSSHNSSTQTLNPFESEANIFKK